MKILNSVYKPVIALTICFLFMQSYTYPQQSNFQIAPSPIAYPYFEDGRYDGTIGGSFISISTTDMSMAGGAGDFKGRMAFSEFTAIDCDLGINMLGGSMPGIPPITPLYTNLGYPYFTEVAGDASLLLFSFRMAVNIEFQPVKSEFGSIILFGGPNINISNFTITTPFNLIVPPPYSNAGEVYTGYTDTLTISTNLTGWQAGIQIDIPLGEGMRLSPFFMYSSFSGTAALTDTTTVSGSDTTSISVDVPGSTSTSFGMDIVFDDFSIGTLLQQMTASDETTQDTSIIMISISYHFSSEDSSTGVEEEKL